MDLPLALSCVDEHVDLLPSCEVGSCDLSELKVWRLDWSRLPAKEDIDITDELVMESVRFRESRNNRYGVESRTELNITRH